MDTPRPPTQTYGVQTTQSLSIDAYVLRIHSFRLFL